jgi:hypothetical protein
MGLAVVVCMLGHYVLRPRCCAAEVLFHFVFSLRLWSIKN